MSENTVAKKVALTQKELNKVFWRSYQALGCYSYDKQQGIPYMRAMIPALEKLYPEKEKFIEALRRHNTMFNTTCAFVPFCLGISCAMEEEYANNSDEMDPESINSVKVALMGPLAGIGDSFFWGLPRYCLRRWCAFGRCRQHSRCYSLSVAQPGTIDADPRLRL